MAGEARRTFDCDSCSDTGLQDAGEGDTKVCDCPAGKLETSARFKREVLPDLQRDAARDEEAEARIDAQRAYP